MLTGAVVLAEYIFLSAMVDSRNCLMKEKEKRMTTEGGIDGLFNREVK